MAIIYNYRDFYYSGQWGQINEKLFDITTEDKLIIDVVSGKKNIKELYESLKKDDGSQSTVDLYNLSLCEYLLNVNSFPYMNKLLDKFKDLDLSSWSNGLMCTAIFLLMKYLIKINKIDQYLSFYNRLKSEIECNYFSQTIDNTIQPFHIDIIEQSYAFKSQHDQIHILYSIQDLNINTLYGPYNDGILKDINSGIYYLSNKKPGNAAAKFRKALTSIRDYDYMYRNSLCNVNSRHLNGLKSMSICAMFYFGESLYDCKSYVDSFTVFKSFLSYFRHPLLYVRMTECCIGLIFGNNQDYYDHELKKDIMKQVIECDGSLYFNFHDPFESNFLKKDIPPFMTLLSCINYLNIAQNLCQNMIDCCHENSFQYPNFLQISNMDKFLIDIKLKLAFCHLKINSFTKVKEICENLNSNDNLSVAEKYLCGLYRSEAVCMDYSDEDEISNNIQILDEQFNETYTLGLEEDPKNNKEHLKNKILRELSQFNSSVLSFVDGKISEAKSTTDTQRLNVDYLTNPLNSMYGVINDICIGQKGYQTTKLNCILFTNLKFAMSQGI